MLVMAIVGWIMSAILLGWPTVVCILCMYNNLGMYNIGGVHNSTTKKILTILGTAVIVTLWMLLFSFTPFHFSLS